MKKIKALSFLLACIMLAIPFIFTASAEMIDFVPVTENGKLYGIPAGSTAKTVGAAFPNAMYTVYDKNREIVYSTSDKLIGTGFTVKLNLSEYTLVVMGDIDGDGSIRPLDYIAVKRAVLNKQTPLSDLGKEALGLEASDKVRAIDYMRIKRAYLGTYNINNAYTEEPYDPAASESGWTPGWV